MGKKAKGKGKDKLGKKERKRAAAAEAAAAEAAASAVGLEPIVTGEPARPAAPSGQDGGRRIVDATELAARLANLSTVLQRELAHSDGGDGLTRSRLSALALLVLGGPRTLGQLAASERVKPPTMTRLVHAMEADGLVERAPNPSDGRSVIIRATAIGERQLERGRTRQIAPLAESISDLDRSERRQLEDASDVLGRVLRDAAWESPEPPE